MKCREVNHMVKRTTWEGCNMGKKSRCGTEVSGKPKMAKQAHTFIRPRTMLLWVIAIADFIGVWPLAYINWIKIDIDDHQEIMIFEVYAESTTFFWRIGGERIVFFFPAKRKDTREHFGFENVHVLNFASRALFWEMFTGKKKNSRVKFLKMFTGAFHG